MRLSNSTLRLLSLSALTLLVTPGSAQETTIVQRKGDNILGAGGAIKGFSKLAVSDAGIIYTNVTTTSTDKERDDVVLLNGFLAVTEDSEVATPVGAKISSFGDLDVNAAGFLGWPLTLKNSEEVTNSNNSGIFFNTLLLARKGDPIFATEVNGVALPANTLYNRFNAAKINDRNSILYSGVLDDPSIAGTEPTIGLLEIDEEGNLTEETVFFLKGYPVPGLGEEFTQVGTSPDSIALANDGSFIAQIKAGSVGTVDSIIIRNNEILAREGDFAPVPGNRKYLDLGGTKVDLNDFGGYVFTAVLDGDANSAALLVVNGEAFVQEGQTFPAIAPYSVDRFDSVGMYIGNSGDVYWYMRSTEGGTSDQFLLRNFETILQENNSTVGGETIVGLTPVAGSFFVSDSGRFWIGKVATSQGDVIVLADFGTSYPLMGCAGNPGSLKKITGDARPGETMFLEMDDAQGVGVLPMIFWSLGSGLPGNKRDTQQCGRMHPVGEIMISLAGPHQLGRIVEAPTDGTPTIFQLDFPNDLALVNLQIYGQGVFYDVAGTTAGPTFQLTNGYYIEIGA